MVHKDETWDISKKHLECSGYEILPRDRRYQAFIDFAYQMCHMQTAHAFHARYIKMRCGISVKI